MSHTSSTDKIFKYIIEQDHHGIKRVTKPMVGFKNLDSAKATITGVEIHRMLRKEQHLKAVNKAIFTRFYELAA